MWISFLWSLKTLSILRVKFAWCTCSIAAEVPANFKAITLSWTTNLNVSYHILKQAPMPHWEMIHKHWLNAIIFFFTVWLLMNYYLSHVWFNLFSLHCAGNSCNYLWNIYSRSRMCGLSRRLATQARGKKIKHLHEATCNSRITSVPLPWQELKTNKSKIHFTNNKGFSNL